MHHLGGYLCDELGLTGSPIEAFHLIRKHNASDGKTGRDVDFERVTLSLIRDGTEQCQSDGAIVYIGRNDEGRAAPGLLMPSLRVKSQPHDVAATGHVGTHHPSRPTRFP